MPDVAAHMFIFYYAVLSEVSPPTALSPFAAAALTGGNPFKTMMLTWKYTLPAFLVPFVFTLTARGRSASCCRGPWPAVVAATVTAAAGHRGVGGGFRRLDPGSASTRWSGSGWRRRGASSAMRRPGRTGRFWRFWQWCSSCTCEAGAAAITVEASARKLNSD